MSDECDPKNLTVAEFNAYLTNWIGNSFDEVLSGPKEYKQNFLKVTIGGVECGLSGDSTRRGVIDYLIAHETGDPTFVVVANKKGTFNRVVVGSESDPIPGFYLYTIEPQSGRTVLEAEPEWPQPDEQSRAEPQELIAWSAPDLTQAPASDLFALQGQLLAELRSRGVLRTNNPPVGDYAEWLVWRAIGAAGERLPANSNPSYDLTSDTFGKVQVKARLVSDPPKSGQVQTSPFRTKGFDHAALVLLSSVDFSVVSAVLLPLAAVEERWYWREHIRGWTVQMNRPTMNHPQAVDITALLDRAAQGLV